MSELAEINFEVRDGFAVTSVSGEIDLSNIESLRRSLNQNLDTAPTHVLDFTATTYVDSVTVRLLFSLAGRLATTGQRLLIVVPDDGSIHRLLEVTDLAEQVPVHSSLDDALSGGPGPV